MMNVTSNNKHLQAVMSKVWDHRTKDELCDVTIKVEKRVFHCHRIIMSAASNYFRAMFTGGFAESLAKEVTLHGVDVNIFDNILTFIYTGEVIIDNSNAIGLIHATEFYGLASLEDRLIEFVKESSRNLSSEAILKMLTSAHTTGLSRLFEFFAKYVYEDFGFFSDSPEFVNLTWNSLMELVRQASSAEKPVLSDMCVEGVLKWILGQVDFSADKREEYFIHFIPVLHQTESFTKCSQYMIDRHVHAVQAADVNAACVLYDRPPKLLRAFVTTRQPASKYGPEASTMFTLHETNAGLAWAYSGEFKAPVGLMKSIVIDDSLYTLIPDNQNGAGVTFGRHRRAFAGAAHMSMNERQSLRPPTCLSNAFDMCGIDNNIFVYHKFADCIRYSTTVRNPDLTFEELLRGVISYKRDIDKWFSVPCPRKFYNSCITCDESRVYLIGGIGSNGSVLAYDPRTSAWTSVARTMGCYEEAACCVRDGKIWVAGGANNPYFVEIFDPVAGTWKRGKNLIRARPRESRLINWNPVHRNPAVVSFNSSSCTNYKILFSDDDCCRGWNMTPNVRLALKESRLSIDKYDRVADMVAF